MLSNSSFELCVSGYVETSVVVVAAAAVVVETVLGLARISRLIASYSAFILLQ
jgi:hypothetical protein